MRVVLALTPRTAEATVGWLSQLADAQVVASVADVAAAIRAAFELGPDVAIIDAAIPPSGAIALAERLGSELPAIAVVLVSEQQSAGLYRQALRSGVAAVLSPPLDAQDLDDVRAAVASRHERMERIRAGAMAARRGRVVAVAAPKDGAGKTVIALSAAAALAERRDDVLLVDLDVQFGDLSAYVRSPDDASAPTLADLSSLISAGQLRKDAVESVVQRRGRLRVLLAPDDPFAADDLSVCLSPACPLVPSFVPASTRPDAGMRGHAIHELVTFLRSAYALTILDTGAAINDISLAALSLADAAVLVTTGAPTHMRNAGKLLEVVHRMGRARDEIAIVVNRVGGADGWEVSGEAMAIFEGHRVVEVPDDRQAARDLLGGNYRPRSRAFKSAIEHVAELMEG